MIVQMIMYDAYWTTNPMFNPEAKSSKPKMSGDFWSLHDDDELVECRMDVEQVARGRIRN